MILNFRTSDFTDFTDLKFVALLDKKAKTDYIFPYSCGLTKKNPFNP